MLAGDADREESKVYLLKGILWVCAEVPRMKHVIAFKLSHDALQVVLVLCIFGGAWLTRLAVQFLWPLLALEDHLFRTGSRYRTH
jgi:hypothetical protein